MYLLTIRDGLQTRHIGPYATPQQAAAHLDQLLQRYGEKARWQIHQLEAPGELSHSQPITSSTPTPVVAA
jgi:hypothetical protein